MKFPTARKWVPKFPLKYKGDHTQIISRSSWETRFLNWCDNNPSILEYSSEEVRIPYKCHTDGRYHTYFVDFYIKVKTRDNHVKSYLVEVKPAIQTQPPKYPGKQTKKYILESITFIKNQSKWAAAKQYALDRGYEFVIITENELGLN